MTAQSDRIGAIIAAHHHREGPLLPILHDIQKEFGCVDAESEALVARGLNLSRAEVHGVVSFYHDFHERYDARPVVQICRAEACQARGVEGLIEAAGQAAGQRVRIESVFCLGLCSAGPAARTGDTLYARLNAARLAKVIETA